MRFLQKSEVRPWFEGRRVCIVGSGPGVLDNEEGFIDGHSVVVRVNNYKLKMPATGMRCDVHFSFYGHSIRSRAVDLINDGVSLCLCKCPNADNVIQSEWHRRRGKAHGIDFAWIYQERAKWWFCDVYVPTVDAFMVKFNLLGGHIPSTGFAAILDVLGWNPGSLYLTGFDFFASGIHNVDEPWREKNRDDPIRHVPDRELQWLAENLPHLPVTCDRRLTEELARVKVAA